jgi:hypothetical protein
MYVLVLDTETTGLFPKGGSAPLPYAVQISYAIIDTSSPFFPIVEDYDAIIRISEQTPLPEESVKIHGITREISQTKGVPIEHALSILQRSLDTYDVQLVVGHNIAFDLRVINTEYARQGASSTPFNPSTQIWGKGGKAPSPSSSEGATAEGASSTPFNPSTQIWGKGGKAPSPSSSEGASSAPLRPPLCPSPSSSPDPTSTPTPTIKAQAGGLRGQSPLQIKNSPGTDSNTFADSTDNDKGGLRGLCPLHKGGQPRRDLMRIRSMCTARESVGVCNLRAESMYGGTYLKFGKLGQVFEILFKERDAARGVDMKVFEKYMHNSRVDVLMCVRVYVWLCYSVDVFDAWYCEMQNYADENFINVDDSHLVVVGADAPSSPNPSPSPSPSPNPNPSPSPRRSDRLRLKRMREQEQQEGPSAQIKNNPLTSRGFKGDSVPLQEQGSVLAY